MEKATLFEVGLLPIVTAGFLWQLAASFRLIKVNLGLRSDRALYQSGQKITAILLTAIYSAGLVLSGYYDNSIQKYDASVDSQKPWGMYTLILVQINAWSLIVTLLVEVFDKGYAFGSGILCFLALQTSTSLVRELIGLETIQIPGSENSETYGLLAYIVTNLLSFSWTNWKSAIVGIFTRTQTPTIGLILIGVLTIAVLIGFQNYRIELPIRSTKARGMNNVYPIRLLYTGALPVLFAYTVLANAQIFNFFAASFTSQISPVFALIFGKYVPDAASNRLVLKSGLISLLANNSTSILKSLLSPLSTVVRSGSVVVLAAWFAHKWTAVSGSAPKDLAKQFKEQGISIAGKRDVSIAKELSRVIPVASVSGAVTLAAVAIASELLGGLGKGAATIIGVSSAFGLIEEFMVEYQQSGGLSQISSAMGAARG